MLLKHYMKRKYAEQGKIAGKDGQIRTISCDEHKQLGEEDSPVRPAARRSPRRQNQNQPAVRKKKAESDSDSSSDTKLGQTDRKQHAGLSFPAKRSHQPV